MPVTLETVNCVAPFDRQQRLWSIGRNVYNPLDFQPAAFAAKSAKMSPSGYIHRSVLVAIGFLAASSAFGQAGAATDSPYKVLPGDKLEISVWGEENLLREVVVRPDGAFSFPLCGEISARDRTVAELQQEVSRRLIPYIADPVVTITVSEILGNKVFVIGQVKNPGAFVVNPNVDVLQALSLAGGTNEFASVNDIRILRRTGNNQETFAFRYDDVTKGRNLEQNIVLTSGDVIIVP